MKKLVFTIASLLSIVSASAGPDESFENEVRSKAIAKSPEIFIESGDLTFDKTTQLTFEKIIEEEGPKAYLYQVNRDLLGRGGHGCIIYTPGTTYEQYAKQQYGARP